MLSCRRAGAGQTSGVTRDCAPEWQVAMTHQGDMAWHWNALGFERLHDEDCVTASRAGCTRASHWCAVQRRVVAAGAPETRFCKISDCKSQGEALPEYATGPEEGLWAPAKK